MTASLHPSTTTFTVGVFSITDLYCEPVGDREFVQLRNYFVNYFLLKSSIKKILNDRIPPIYPKTTSETKDHQLLLIIAKLANC